MVEKYTIRVKNNSGAVTNYVLVTEVPKITGIIHGKIWSNVFATAKVGNHQPATFTIYKQYFAVVGYSAGTPQDGVTVNVGDTKEVAPGYVDQHSGTKVKGTTKQMISTNDIPEFSDDDPPSQGMVNAFEFSTDNHFTVTHASQNNWMIGLGGSSGSNTSTAAVFTPQPSTNYQIQPQNIYYLTTGDYSPGDIINIVKTSQDVLKLDFTGQGGSPIIDVTHNSHGGFNINTVNGA